MINYKNELNDQQYQIVTRGDGHCLVLAGAGSGKTPTLIYRVAYLLEKGVKPQNILLMTFTNKAADEMAFRVKSLLGYEPYGLWAGTFHKICNQILRKYAYLKGFSANYAILDANDSKDVLKLCVKELGINLKEAKMPKVDVLAAIISKARNSGIEVQDYINAHYAFPVYIANDIENIAKRYASKKKNINAMDFDDLLIMVLELLSENSQVCHALSDKFHYILIDEYQDTNIVQARLIEKLGSIHHNILVVGDDAQSIYSFRAANIQNILDFPKQFNNANIFKIETNYRSSPEILALANESIKNNVNQYGKELKSFKQSSLKPVLRGADDPYDQAGCVIKRVQDIVKNKGSLKDVAVLFRAAHHSAELQLMLSKYNIPFIVRSGLRFFDSAHIKDIIAFLRVWQNINDEISWTRILKMLPHIGERSAQKVVSEAKKKTTLQEFLSGDMPLSAKQAQSFNAFKEIFVYLNDLSLGTKGFIAEGISFILQKYYKNYLQKSYEDAQSRYDDLAAFLDFSSSYDNLDNLISDITLNEDFKDKKNENIDKLVLSTIHQAKGLEWPEVIIIGLHKGSFPHFRSFESSAELEEERRLFYVAVTRAMERLTFLYPMSMKSFEYGQIYTEPSLFVTELPQDTYIDFTNPLEEEKGGRELLTRNARWKKGDNYFKEDDFFQDEEITYD